MLNEVMKDATAAAGGSGGGHPGAAGGIIPRENLEIFIDEIRRMF